MDELDGVWAVERVSGALPPLIGCVKRIHGKRGTTEFPRVPGMPFEVRGLELHYRGPFSPLVDKLEPSDGGYVGQATLFGRELGRFTLRRLDAIGQLQAQLVKHIAEAHAMEQDVLRMLDGMISTTDDPGLRGALVHHRAQTRGHADRMEERLRAHDVSPSGLKQLGGVVGVLARMPLDLVRGESAGRNARERYSAEHMQIASYELLRRIAEKAGDEETARAAQDIIVEEQQTAATISASWDEVAELSLREEGITV